MWAAAGMPVSAISRAVIRKTSGAHWNQRRKAAEILGEIPQDWLRKEALRLLTEEEKAVRMRALGAARQAEAEARARAEENARRAAEEAQRRRYLVDPDAAAVVVFTSGTTSTPKGVIHTVNSLRCGVANMVDALHLDARDTLFLASPVASITGVLQLESALSVGARVVLAERFSPEHAFEQVQATGATVIGGAPVIAEAVFAEADRRGLTSLPLRCIALGGAMIPPTVVESANRFGVRVVRVYGSSEVPFSTSTALDAYSSDDGVALPGVDVAIGDSGELLISGPHQFHGYLDPVHNDESFDGDQVRTGDLAELLTDHRIRITGRLKEIVIRKGKKISLPEIDLAATGLGECAAFAVPDEQTGERLALAIRGTTTAVTYQAVRDELTAVGLAVWKLPEQIVVWSGEFPRTPSGKVIRRALADETRWSEVLYAPRLAEDSGQRI